MPTRAVFALRGGSIILRLLAPLLLLVGGVAAAAAAQAPATADCQACHGDPSAARANGSSVAVASDPYAGSVHGSLACVDCHQDLATQAEWPHPERLARVSCASCHGDTVATHAASVHAQRASGGQGGPAASCADCHGTHDIRPSADRASKTHHVNLAATCGRCHAVVKQFEDGIHGRALIRSGLTVAPDCTSCHGSHDIQPQTAVTSRIHRTQVPSTCGTCHEGIAHEYRAGIHGEQLLRGVAGAPGCADCHAAHATRRIDTPSFQLAVVQECGTCHRDKIQTYRDTFHGQVTALGFERVAKCADCHGAHQVLPKSNPASMIADANLVATCSRCHDGVTRSFVQYDPHPDPHDYARNPVLWWVNRFYVVLISGCFTFFGLHSALWFWRSRRDGEGMP